MKRWILGAIGSWTSGTSIRLIVGLGAVAGLLAPSARAGPLEADASQLRRAGHLLNRAAFGPTHGELKRIIEIGTEAWIEEQLAPESIGDGALASRVAALTERVVNSKDRYIVRRGELWRYRKGTTAPPAGWFAPQFDDSSWSEGPSGIGYGDDDDLTVLDDMRMKYGSIFIRRRFTISEAELDALNDLVLRLHYDDAFVAFLNGVEVARSRNLPVEPGEPVPFDAFAVKSREAGAFEDFNISARKDLLEGGENVLAIQVHNRSLQSSDLSIIPQLLDREEIPGTARYEIKGLEELKALSHVYAIYSRRQLQTVLALFWENHFTTDADKVGQYLDDLKDSDASDALPQAEALRVAARLEHREFEFFRKNALGNFGDLLRHSATSPTMLIYLDNVLNVLGNANENYAREILELHTYGVDNGYDQVDIEQLSKCFTGWGVAKSRRENADDPHGDYGVKVDDTLLVRPGEETKVSGKNWRYFKGTSAPPLDWNQSGFDDSGWPVGPGGIGYGDDDDATVLDDMRNKYTSVYLRKTFTIADPSTLASLILRIDVDDGCVAFVNGYETARFNAPGKSGEAVKFDAVAPANHEAGEPIMISLAAVRHRLVAGKNVLAVHVLNHTQKSSDLSASAELVDRTILPGSVENSDPRGVWTFHFFPELHNSAGSKHLFKGTPHALEIGSGREGPAGLKDAEEAIRRILEHPSTSIFVCTKLIQRLVSDEIDFRTPQEGPFAGLLSRCVDAWNSTEPKGNIRKVVKTILSSPEFWSERAYRAKIKDPFEFIVSTLRALNAESSGLGVTKSLASMGMELFTRDDPDGWPELGGEWVDTGSFQSRILFAQTLTETQSSGNAYQPGWDAESFVDGNHIETADDIVKFFEATLFQGMLRDSDRDLVRTFLTTDAADEPLPLERSRPDYLERVRRALGLMLSLPEWQFQ